MARPKPRHAARPPMLGRVVRVVVPTLAISALGAGLAFSLPEQAVTTAVPVTSTPLGRATDEAVSRSYRRPALTASPTTDSVVAAKKAADLKAAADRKAETDAKAAAARKAAAKMAEQAAAAKKAAEQAAAAKKVAKPEKTGTVDSRYAEVTLNLRSAPEDAARTGTDVATGAKVTVTGYTLGAWAQVKTGSRTGWVKKSYLSSDQPKVASSSSPDSGSGGGVSSGACPSSSVESGLTSDAVKVHRAICHAFPVVKSYGGVRADSLPEHPSGRALDAMISSQSQGQEIADWVRAHASELGVSQVIFAQRIWTVQRSGEGWRSMSDRGSATANHYDHVHVTVYGNAAK